MRGLGLGLGIGARPQPPGGGDGGNGGETEPDVFILTDDFTSDQESPSVSVDIGAAHANRTIVAVVSFRAASGGSFGAPDIITATLGGEAPDFFTYVFVDFGRRQAVIFRWDDVSADTTKTLALTRDSISTSGRRWAVAVYRGIGPYGLDLRVHTSTTGGSISVIGGHNFAVSTVGNTTSDTEIAGISNDFTNVSGGSDHRGSIAYQALAAGNHTLDTDAAEVLRHASFKKGFTALNIALVAADTSHASATNTKADLEDFGHTVTLIDDVDIGTTDFSSYDLIVAARLSAAAPSNSDAIDSTVASGLRTLADNGKPIVAGATCSGMSAGTGRTTLATAFNLTGTWRIMNSTDFGTELVIADNSHEITGGFAEATYAIYSAANFMGTVTAGQSTVGTSLATGDPDEAGSGEVALIAVEAGTTDLAAGTTGARIVVGDFPYAGQSRHTDIGRTLLNRACQWAAGNI